MALATEPPRKTAPDVASSFRRKAARANPSSQGSGGIIGSPEPSTGFGEVFGANVSTFTLWSAMVGSERRDSNIERDLRSRLCESDQGVFSVTKCGKVRAAMTAAHGSPCTARPHPGVACRGALAVGLVVITASAGACGGGGHRDEARPATYRPTTSELGDLPATGLSTRRSAPRRRAWSLAQALAEAGGRRIVVDGRGGLIYRATLVCWGAGRPSLRRGVRVWTRFSCLSPTFRGSAVGRDLAFVLLPTGRHRFAT